MVALSEELTIEPIELVAGGEALARVDGLPIFTRALFPGDVARVRIVEVKKGFARAELLELVRPSGSRRVQPCPVAGECGGCDWTALRLDNQLEAKERILVESLRRIGKFDPKSLPSITVHPSPLNYRLRSRLHREGDAIGFFALRSNRVVPLASECEVVGVETARSVVSPRSSVLGHLSDDAIEIWEIGGELITGEREITLRVDGQSYRLSTRSFFQVNRHLLGTMLHLVERYASRVRSKKVAIDLYAGIGFFTLPLARQFEHVIAVEGSAESASWARTNVPAHVRVVARPVEAWAASMRDTPFVFLDPPRAGARRDVIDAIAHHAREMVCYLSCDPVTFARDASRLTASGWRLATLDLLDLFPNTHHVETFSSFERAP